MLAPTRQSPRRRRSQSTSSPLTSARRLEEKWRVAAKRPRPANPRSPSSKDLASDQLSQKWDVDRWRKGKRARRDSASPVPTTRGPCLFGSSSVFRNELGPAPSLGLPSTSDAFDFFPSRPREGQSSSHCIPSIPEITQNTSTEMRLSPAPDVVQLRSEAFCELRRTVAESGAGLLSRMRDWEESPSRRLPWSPGNVLFSERGRQELAFNPQAEWASSAQAYADEDDDIQIVSGSHFAAPTATYGSPSSRKPRAFSMSDMDVDGPEDGASLRCDSSLLDTASSAPSGYTSEDEAPALSFTRTNSTNSSLVSLTSHTHPAFAATTSETYPLGTAASPSEKAIAALTLVMSNGAGGLNDYEPVRALEGPSRASLDECHIGEMWN